MKRILLVGGISLVAVMISVVVAVIAFGEQTPTEDPQPIATNNTSGAENLLTFPRVIGTNLKNEQATIPTDLAGTYKLIVVSYDDDQQPIVNRWLPPLEALNEEFPMLAGYYMPMLPKSASSSSLMIIGGMSLVAESDEDRERTWIAFTSIDAFNALIQVDTTDMVQLFLLNADHQIIWQGSGDYQPAALAELRAILVDDVTS